MSRKIGLYVSSADVTAEQRAELQHIFDTAQDFPEIDPIPGLIQLVPDSEWALNADVRDILIRHRERHIREYMAKPVVILDERTAKDGSVVLVAPTIISIEAGGPVEPKAVRFEAARVPGAAVNIQISNQTLEDLEYHVDDDGVWRAYRPQGQ